MSISGNLKTMPLTELLQWLGTGRKTGTLVIDDGRVEKRIYFRDGRIISSSSSDPREYLGHFLVSYGFISEPELSKAIAMQEKTQMMLGKILTSIGAIGETDLHRLLRQKAEEAIYGIFSWEEGEFRFVDDDLPSHAMVPMDLDVTGIVLEGVQRLDEWKRMRDAIPSNQAVPVSVTDLLADSRLTPGEKKILELVDDDRSIEDIQLETHSSEYRVSKVLFDQMQKKRLKIVRPRGGGRSGRGTGDPAAGAEPIPAAELAAAGRNLIAAGENERGLRHLRAARSLEPDDKAIQQALTKAEEEIATAIEAAGISLDATPESARSMDELTRLDLTPQEGFILSRLDGNYDIRSIVKISPMPKIDALLTFHRLLQAGHIRLR